LCAARQRQRCLLSRLSHLSLFSTVEPPLRVNAGRARAANRLDQAALTAALSSSNRRFKLRVTRVHFDFAWAKLSNDILR
jgi:hypothetical protein